MLDETLIAGLDLGQKKDYPVLAVVGRTRLPQQVAKRRFRYELRWLETWELGTRYTATRPGERSIIGDVKRLFDRPPLTRSPLAVDYNGVGIAVVEQITAAKVLARLHPICSTSGHTISRPEETKDGSWHVPKTELIGTLIVVLENELLSWEPPDSPNALPLIDKFEKELAAFRGWITRKKNVGYGAEQSQHDDIVLAVALAIWLGERVGTGDPSGISVGGGAEGGGSVAENAPPGVWAERPGDSMRGRYGPDGR